jgi:hypothetical protein
VKQQERQMAYEQGACSLRALDLRATRLARFARRLDPHHNGEELPGNATPEQRLAASARQEARRLEDVVRLALHQLALFLLERRTRHALGGLISVILILLAVGGLGFALAVADYAKGQRSLTKERVLRGRACIAAVKAAPPLATKQQTALINACLAAVTQPTTTSARTTQTTASTTTSSKAATTTTGG